MNSRFLAGIKKATFKQEKSKSGPNFPCFFNKIFLNQTFINIKSFKISKTVPPEPSQGQFLNTVCTNSCMFQIILHWK